MAGYSKIFCIGDLGGFQGADGINPILFQILVGDADRQWYEVIYFNKSIKPIGQIKIIIPENPNNPNALLDSCIAFYPSCFSSCPSLKVLEAKLAKATRLDFDLRRDIPQEWYQLRKDALPLFKLLNIFEANFKIIDLSNFKIA